MLAGGGHQPDDVLGHGLVDVDLLDAGLHLPQLLQREDLAQVVDRVQPLLLVEDDDLLHRLRVAKPKAEHEPIELGLRQREGALVLDRVLGGDHQERRRHRVRDTVDGRLPLLHALEQRRLGLRRGAVDLVGEDDLGHDRSRPELELLRLLVEDREAGDVGRQQVGRELDAAEGAADALGERLGEHRLADARHVLDQDVSLAQQGDEGHPHLDVLADDHALDVGDDALRRLLDVLHHLFSCSFVWADAREGGTLSITIPHTVTGRLQADFVQSPFNLSQPVAAASAIRPSPPHRSERRGQSRTLRSRL